MQKMPVSICAGVFLILFLFSGCPPADQEGPAPPPSYTSLVDDWPAHSLIQRTHAASYHVTASVRVTDTDCSATMLCVMLPVPRPNVYQDIDNVNLSGGELLSIEGTSDQYFRFLATTGLPQPGQTAVYSIEYDVTLYTILISWGGGDCGNLSSLFISLLRCKQIPARHLVSVRPDGSFHAWADFYLEQYGWIPVDVTYAEADANDGVPGGNYFGNVVISGNGIIMTKEVFLPVDRGDSLVFLDLLQSYAWWYWGSGGSMAAVYSLDSVLL